MVALSALLSVWLAAAPPAVPSAALEALALRVEEGYRRRQSLQEPASKVLLEATTRVAGFFPELTGPVSVLSVAATPADARALPGQRILFQQGLWPYLHQTEDLLFVLAHEMAHMVLGHIAQRVGADQPLRRDWELAADAEAVQRLAAAGVGLDSLPALLDRLSEAGQPLAPTRLAALHGQLPARSAGHRRVAEPSLQSAQTKALQLWLQHGMTEPTAWFLDADTAAVFGQFRVLLALRQQQYSQIVRLSQASSLRWQALAAEGIGDVGLARELWLTWLSTASGPEVPLIQAFTNGQCVASPAPAQARQGHRFGGYRWPLTKPWRVALQTADRLVLTPDHTALSRLDIWRPGTAPGAAQSVPTKCSQSPLNLWQAMAGVRRELAPQSVTEIQWRALAEGWESALEYHDAAGIKWRVLVLRRGAGDHAITALFRAPAQPYYDRHVSAVRQLITSAGS